MKTGILFDLDGTLLSTLEDLTDAVNYTLRHYNCPERTQEEICSFLGYGAKWLIASALPENGKAFDVDQVLAFYQKYYAAHCQVKTRPYDGILEALAELRKEFPVAIVSNKPDIATKPLCKEYFGGDIYALGESASCPRKPAPDMVYRGMHAIGVETCIYVGDSEVDVQTARNAGVPCLSVLWGFRDREYLQKEGGTHFCDDPKKLATCLKEMIENG
jgi:phosphoglycolate phosphatase